jgi:hypothetical protein
MYGRGRSGLLVGVLIGGLCDLWFSLPKGYKKPTSRDGGAEARTRRRNMREFLGYSRLCIGEGT